MSWARLPATPYGPRRSLRGNLIVHIDRRTFLLTALATAACSSRGGGTPLEKAAKYLWEQQARDGGFHSTNYGLLHSGQSLTPFVLGALIEVPETVLTRSKPAVDRAFQFIRRHTDANGALGLMDATSPDYPNYATSLAVVAMVKAQPDGHERDTARMVIQLRSQQFSEANGWTPGDSAYGAWGMGGPVLRPPEAGHVDLSMTRCVLEALKATGVPASDAAIERALVYLKRSQNEDGGFYFSTVNEDTNKAGETNGGFKSYGSATADGVLALRAAAVPDSDQRIVKAIKWLTDHHQPDCATGFEGEAYQTWSTGLRFYYADVISRAVPSLRVNLPEQSADGSFRNSNKLVKEDDPLIATPFAVGVLLRQ